MSQDNRCKVLVIGGGHAGVEAACAASRLQVNTILLTLKEQDLGRMSCNPSIGGIGKTHLIKDIDALDGAIAHLADRSAIHWRTLNARKGPAVRATRGQIDRALYQHNTEMELKKRPNLKIVYQSVEELLFSGDRVIGAALQDGSIIGADAVVLATGTFLAGSIHIGLQTYPGGRSGDPASIKLARCLRQLPLKIGRLKTGTPPRIDGRSINYALLQEQPSEVPIPGFSYLPTQTYPEQISCFITHTNENTHAIIRDNLDHSPLYTGIISGTGPRYCPSIEDKVVRFSERSAHQIFLEPEGLTTHSVYPNGISTSLPFDIQCKIIHSIMGLEHARITAPGYAIEYDFFDPRDLWPYLESRYIKNLFFAGQINGTTGYEEAAAQGLIAGLNAALKTKDQEPWWPRRDQAYIGVLLDDLTTQGVTEPYRMFTSRAEYRLLLRQDNADLRLTEQGYRLGLVGEHRLQCFCKKRELIAQEQKRLQSLWIKPNTHESFLLEKHLQDPIMQAQRVSELLARPELNYQLLTQIPTIGPGVDDLHVQEQIDIQAKYQGYIIRQQRDVEQQLHHEQTRLPESLIYENISGLSTEIKQILSCHKPITLGQASRLPGVTPVAISILLIYLKKKFNANSDLFV